MEEKCLAVSGVSLESWLDRDDSSHVPQCKADFMPDSDSEVQKLFADMETGQERQENHCTGTI